MNRALLFSLTLVALLTLTGAGKVFKWIDKDGNIHYGDSVPPEYADQVFGKGEGDVDDEDLEKARRDEQDRILLKTYLSVEDIERVRDRRVDQLKARQEVTSRYLDSLNERLAQLEKLAAESAVDPETGANIGTPDDVLFDIQQTQDSIKVYQDRMARNESEQQTIHEKFATDIARFRQLKGLSEEPSEGESVAPESTVSDSR
jgi:hypothetical protein